MFKLCLALTGSVFLNALLLIVTVVTFSRGGSDAKTIAGLQQEVEAARAAHGKAVADGITCGQQLNVAQGQLEMVREWLRLAAQVHSGGPLPHVQGE